MRRYFVIQENSVPGEWLNISIHVAKQLGSLNQEAISNTTTYMWYDLSLEALRLQNLKYYWISSVAVSFVFYIGIGGFLHVSYYNNKLSFININRLS